MYHLLRPLLFRLDAERAHRIATGAAKAVQQVHPALIRPVFSFAHPALRQRVWGLDFPNPVGLAAGFDKNAQLIPFWEALGFGFIEVGSVTARASKGNPMPRAFRLPDDEALINRMGLNNDGADVIAARLAPLTLHARFPIGVNVAKTHDPAILGDAAIADFRKSVRLLTPHADYLALNVSCPNTAEGKTFETPDALDALLQAVFEERTAAAPEVPVLVKFSPPLTGAEDDGVLREMVQLSRSHGVAGFIATNTASDRTGLRTPHQRLDAIGRGGLSGQPLEARSRALTRTLYRLTNGEVPIIGVGGIASGEIAYRRIRAGASLLQLYTGLIYEGPGLVKQIKQHLVASLERDGFASVAEAVGADARA